MSEEFEKWFPEKDGTSIDTLYSLEYYLSGVRDAFAAGQAAAIDAMNKLPHRAMFDSGWARGAQDEREACREAAINSQGTVSQFMTIKECVAYNEGCRAVATAIRKRGEVTSERNKCTT